MNQRELLSQMQQGDVNAFTEAYNAYAGELIAWVSRKVLSLDDALDLVHDVFVHLWLDKGKITDIRPYLFYIARNKVVDYFRKHATRAEYATLHGQLHQQAAVDNPLKSIEAKDLYQHIELLIDNLPARTREIFRMSRHEQLSTGEIADKLGLSEQTVKNQLTTALKYLRSHTGGLSQLALIWVLYS